VNRLLPNDLIIIRNHRDNEENVRDTKDMVESPRDVHKRVEIQTNLKFQSPTSSPTRSPRLPCIQIDAQDAYDLRFGRYTYAQKAKEIIFPLQLV
jgi:hypothetical protein